MSIEVEYKGYKIEFSEGLDNWGCHEAPVEPSESLLAVKAQIDAHIKKESAFPRQTALTAASNTWKKKKPQVVEVTVTSMSADNSDYFWIINDDGDRRKEASNGLFLDCQENRVRADRIESLTTEIEERMIAKEKLFEEMVRFTPKK